MYCCFHANNSRCTTESIWPAKPNGFFRETFPVPGLNDIHEACDLQFMFPEWAWNSTIRDLNVLYMLWKGKIP